MNTTQSRLEVLAIICKGNTVKATENKARGRKPNKAAAKETPNSRS
jgi:hypothetical protein